MKSFYFFWYFHSFVNRRKNKRNKICYHDVANFVPNSKNYINAICHFCVTLLFSIVFLFLFHHLVCRVVIQLIRIKFNDILFPHTKQHTKKKQKNSFLFSIHSFFFLLALLIVSCGLNFDQIKLCLNEFVMIWRKQTEQ